MESIGIFQLQTFKRFSILIIVLCMSQTIRGQCPWSKNLTELNKVCKCSYVQSKLSLDCSAVNFTKLLHTLRESEEKLPVDLLRVTNSSLPSLKDDSFYNLRITTIHFANCDIGNISEHAFRDLEDSLLNLNLPQNDLTEEILPKVRKLRALTSLDISQNKFQHLPEDAFKGLNLDTLNLMENNLTIADNALRGLEKTLKNLNLKGTGLTRLPPAIQNLTALAFLDLAQNSIQDASTSFFINMNSLTALSLERNELRELQPGAFFGLDDTMSSLSLLNNQFQALPTTAVSILKELRVLDLGFNKISVVPEDAFQNTSALTLLALDGNPLSTLPFAAFEHLRSTLRGLSVGGRSFVCDCNIRWIAEWVREYDLQVTSRERNPQFCGHPAAQRNKNLYLLRPAQLVCPETTTTSTTSTTTTKPTTTTAATTTPSKQTTATGSPKQNATKPSIPEKNTTSSANVTKSEKNATESTLVPKLNSTLPTTTGVMAPSTTVRAEPSTSTPTTENPLNNPPLLVRSSQNQRAARNDAVQDIRIREARREDSTIIISWDIAIPNIPGFRVVYRTFGDTVFKEGAVLPLRVRKFRMTNVPTNECIIVCVISLAESGNITADGVPRSNCREMKSEEFQSGGHAEIDKIVIIAASAAICAAVIIAVIIFVCCNRRRCEKQPPLPPPIVSLPPLEPAKPEWDNASAYSSRSIPRARMYHLGRGGGTVNSAFLPDDARSHLSHMSSKHHGDRPPSIIDGQYGPYMNPHTGHTNTLPNPYPLGRPDMTISTKSLAQMPYHSTMTANRKKRPQRNGKWTSMSTGGSVHSLNAYDNENGYFHPNPWAGSEMDHYPSGNHISQPYNKRDYT